MFSYRGVTLTWGDAVLINNCEAIFSLRTTGIIVPSSVYTEVCRELSCEAHGSSDQVLECPSEVEDLPLTFQRGDISLSMSIADASIDLENEWDSVER